MTRLKANRKVNPDGRGIVPLSVAEVSASGKVLHLVGYGPVRVFRLVDPDGDIEYRATSDLGMDETVRQQLAEWSFAIENYHRDLKQTCGGSVRRPDRRGGNATTSGWRCRRSCGWSTISSPLGSVATKRRDGSSGMP